MTYKVVFKRQALKEFQKLPAIISNQFLDKLKEHQQNPHIPSARLHGMKDCYKIKLQSLGYRLVYQVIDQQIVIEVIAVGKRNRNEVYRRAQARLS